MEFAGSRELIEDGARAVVCGEDILAEYGGVLPEKPQPQVYDLFEDLVVPALKTREAVPALADAAAQVSPQARQVLAVLGREPLDIAALEAKTGLPASSLLGLLTELELEGLAESLPGKRYLRGI